MGIIQPPRLDDRNFEELRLALIRRIPVHSTEWTDHNGSDPGIALLELFAWLGENLLYRMNRVPEKAQLEFLRLLNIAPRPASVAHALVKFSQKKQKLASGEPLSVKLSPTIPRPVVAAGDVEFQILDEITVFPAETRAYIKESRTLEGMLGGEEVEQLLADHLNPEGTPETSRVDVSADRFEVYEVTALPEVEAGVLPSATSLGGAVDHSLWIALAAPKDAMRAELKEGGSMLQNKLDELRGKLAGKVLSLGVRVDDELCSASDHQRCPDPGTEDSKYPVIWQIATGRFETVDVNGKGSVNGALYDRLRVEKDGTRALGVSGVIRLRLPRGDPGGSPGFGDWTADQFEPSTPDILGMGNLPPRIDNPDFAPRVLTWIRCFRENERHPPPRLRWIDINAVEACQAVTASRETLGFGTGRPGQVVRLSRAPIILDSLVLQVNESGSWVKWQRVEDLALSFPNDPHYQIETASGEIRFGDGVHGRMPLPGEAIRCLSYQYGGGAAGNVPADSITSTKPTQGRNALADLEVTNPLAARGGRDSETPHEARSRIPKALKHRERAVAAEDFAELALATPGVHVGRAEVLPRHKPHERVEGVPGVVTLVVLPASDLLHPDTPTPDRDMLRRVCEHLEPRRLVTTELYVTPPEYVPVWVSVAIEVEERYGIETVERWVELATRQYLAPLPPYGPDGKGWPFRHHVLPADIEAAVLRVEGVRLVHEVLTRGQAVLPDGRKLPVQGPVPMRKWQLPHLKTVQVVEDVAAEPIDTTIENADPKFPRGPGVPDPGDEVVVIQVPAEREEC